MPELPEVETVCRGLAPVMIGRVIERVELRRAGLRLPFPPGLKETLEGRRVTGLTRRAKYILVGLEGRAEATLALHLGMSGRMTVVPDMARYERQKHDHMLLTLETGQGVVFNDPRRFGMALLFAPGEMEAHPSFRPLGPEPLDSAFDSKALKMRLEGKKAAIKLALLDQRVVAGIGNIYACEALYEAKIDPWKEAGSLSVARCAALTASIKAVLTRAIAAGGSSLRDYRQASGELGYFQHSFLVYDREGQACPRCRVGGKKAHTIKRTVQAGRSTFYCPGCQK